MKTRVKAAVTATERQPTGNPGESAPRRRRGRLDAVKAARRAGQKQGAYKRVELFLGLEAAIALRQLMRDGRSAREVIEALLLDAKRRRGAATAANSFRPP
jgi:hypothetical protein